MSKEAVSNRGSSHLALVLVAVALLLFSAGTPTVFSQGKGGTIKPIPTPTPAPKKTTTPAKTNRAGVPKPPSRQTEPKAVKNPAVEVAFWETIKASTNPDDFREYLKKYPNGEFAGLARNRLNALEAAAKEDAARKEEARIKEEEAKKVEAKRKEIEALKRPGAVVKNSIGMELVYVPAGSFMMGQQHISGRGGGGGEETPVHQVTFREGFFMGRYEVTQAQWQKVMGNNPSYFKDCGGNCPVENVSWNDAQEFIRKLNALTDDFQYHLPSEAQWEYTARARTTTTFFWGEDANQACKYANLMDQTWKEKALKMGWRIFDEDDALIVKCRDGYDEIAPVGSFQPNTFGLYDMSGNVWEYCEDFYHDDYSGAPTDGSAWLSGGEMKERILRGGSFNHVSFDMRSAGNRVKEPPDTRAKVFGFRVVASTRIQ
jgi:formylglycine-generating enzyme required for sulfatase activity